jgi:hypothetical protein
MIIFYGVRQYGRIEEHAGSSIATQFAHLWFVPLFPIRSHLVLGDPGGGKFSGIPIPLSGRSVAAGYLRIWGPILTLFCGIGALDALASASTGRFDWVGAFLFYGFVAMSALVGTVIAWGFLGKLDSEDKLRRAVHALHLGHHADPAQLGDARASLRETLLRAIDGYAEGLWSPSYRATTDVRVHWHYIALDPGMRHEGLLAAAFSLARLEGSLAAPAQQAQLAQIESQLWRRIRELNPRYLQGVLA